MMKFHPLLLQCIIFAYVAILPKAMMSSTLPSSSDRSRFPHNHKHTLATNRHDGTTGALFIPSHGTVRSIRLSQMRLSATPPRALSMTMSSNSSNKTKRKEKQTKPAGIPTITTASAPPKPAPPKQQKRATPWTARFDELCRYTAKHGHCRVPPNCNEYPGLAVWVRNQRTHYRNVLHSNDAYSGSGSSSSGRRRGGPYLLPERIEALQSIGFTWSEEQREHLWKTRFDELVRFRDVYGHCLVPERYHQDVTLGNWVAHQRRTYKQFLAGEANGLTLERIRSLDKIGFCWTERDFRWYSMLQRLKHYLDHRRVEAASQQQQESDAPADDQHKYKPEWFTISHDDWPNRDLRVWVAVQRKEYSNFQKNSKAQNHDDDDNDNDNDDSSEKKYCAITQRRIDALEEIDFPWKSAPRIQGEGPTVDDWSKLFLKMKEKGIDSRAKAKTHWFEGQSLIRSDYDERRNKLYTEEELLELWNMGDDDDED